MQTSQLLPVEDDPQAVMAALGTGPVPAMPYYSPDYFAAEREAVFKCSWLHIGRVSEVAQPGSFIVRAIEIAKASVLVIHGADGVIRAFHNVCTHRGSVLVVAEEGKAPAFSCRYHAWTYDTLGKLKGVPDAGRFHDLDLASCGLKPIALETIAGFIFINLARQPEQGLRAFLGPVADILEARELSDCDVFSEYRYQVRANWKLAYDNFQEVYHLRWVHEHSIGKSSTSTQNPFGYGTSMHFYGQHRGLTLGFNPDYRPGPVEAVAQQILVARKDGPRFSEAEPTQFICVFPNLFLFLSKGRYFTQQIWPLAADQSRSVTRVYWSGADASASTSFGREFAMASTLDVHSEDRDVIESGQAGLESGAIDHILFQEQEALCRHFMRKVDDMVQDWRAEQGA